MISVVVPAYNAGEYINDCLDSLINQTFDNLEIIVVNDGSTDNTEKIVVNYAEKYRNIKLITQENQGVSAARNCGIEKANGQYLFFGC